METKPGIKTSEFWLSLLVALAGSLSAAFSTEPWAKALGAVAAAFTAVGYSFARSQIKRDQQ